MADKSDYYQKYLLLSSQYCHDIDEVRQLLRERDGGAHDADCKINYGRQCNCGHNAVKEYFER